MHTDMEWWTRIRLRMAQEDITKWQLYREEGIGWSTLEKVLSHLEPPGYRWEKPARWNSGRRVIEVVVGDGFVKGW